MSTTPHPLKKRILWLVFGLIVLLPVLWSAVALVRLSIATRQIGTPAPVARLAEGQAVHSLSILPLYDEAVRQPNLEMGHGVSYLIKTDQTTILFDTGNNPSGSQRSPLEANMQQLGVTLEQIDLLVFSHNHPDHTGGAGWWQQNSFSIGSRQVSLGERPIYVPESMRYPGSAPEIIDAPRWLAPGVATTGVLPFAEPTPMWLLRPVGMEQALVIDLEGAGLVIVTGCGHPGIQAIVQRAQTLSDRPVVAVIGGLHLMNSSETDLQPQIDFLKPLDLRLLALSPHDSDAPALAALQKHFPAVYQTVQVGETLDLNQLVR